MFESRQLIIANLLLNGLLIVQLVIDNWNLTNDSWQAIFDNLCVTINYWRLIIDNWQIDWLTIENWWFTNDK